MPKIRSLSKMISLQIYVHFLLTGLALGQYTYTLYQNSTPGTTNLSLLNSTLPTVFIVHGWKQDGTQPWTVQMKKAYLSIQDTNVVVFSWAPCSMETNYFTAAICVKTAGENLGQTLITLRTNKQITVATTHFVGFSLGGHVIGVAGETFKARTGILLEMFIGLEAPSWGFSTDSGRLSQDDAAFVLAFHTSGLGRADQYGHVDVYFNKNWYTCGTEQPNCPANPGVDVPSNFDSNWCNHIRSVAYWIEAILNNQFLGVKCTCMEFMRNVCSKYGVKIGYGMSTTVRGAYYLTTNGNSSFGKGTGGY